MSSRTLLSSQQGRGRAMRFFRHTLPTSTPTARPPSRRSPCRRYFFVHSSPPAAARRALHADARNEEQIECDVCRRAGERGPERCRALLCHDVDAAHEVEKRRRDHREREDRDIAPGVIVALRREQPDEQRRKRDDAARAEADRGEERVSHARVKARLRPAVARLGDGGELPGVHKHRGEDGQDGRYLVGNGVDAVGIAPHEPFHQITVRHAHDPPEDSRGDQRHAVSEHLPPERGAVPGGAAARAFPCI